MNISLANRKGEEIEDRINSDTVPRVGETIFYGGPTIRRYEVLAVTHCVHKSLIDSGQIINLVECTVKRVKA